jgi:hypothetical protein
MNPPSLPQAYPPPMGYQPPPPSEPRPGTPWMVVGIFALLALVVGFAGGTGFGYVIGRGGPAVARAARDPASDAERVRATNSMVQTLRSQLALYRLQHFDNNPKLEQLQDGWSVLVRRTDVNGSTTPALGKGDVRLPYGPYMQSVPVNPLNGKSGVCSLESPTADAGWAYDADTGRIKAIAPTDTAGDDMSDDVVVHVRG